MVIVILGGVKVNYKIVGVMDVVLGEGCDILLEFGEVGKVVFVFRKVFSEGELIYFFDDI